MGRKTKKRGSIVEFKSSKDIDIPDVDRVTEDYLTCNGEFSIDEELRIEKRIANAVKAIKEGSPSKNKGKHE